MVSAIKEIISFKGNTDDLPHKAKYSSAIFITSYFIILYIWTFKP